MKSNALLTKLIRVNIKYMFLLFSNNTQKISNQIAQLFLNINLMLIYIATALVLPLRLHFTLNRTTSVMLKGTMR